MWYPYFFFKGNYIFQGEQFDAKDKPKYNDQAGPNVDQYKNIH